MGDTVLEVSATHRFVGRDRLPVVGPAPIIGNRSQGDRGLDSFIDNVSARISAP